MIVAKGCLGSTSVTPAEAGVHNNQEISWIPAYAGMTVL